MRRLLIACLLLLPCAACERREASREVAGASSPASAADNGDAGDAAEGVLLHDDFSDPTSGWTVRDRGGYRNEYADGRYVLWVDNAASSYVGNVAYRPEELADVRIEVEATRIAGAPNANVGIDCRRAGAEASGTYYADVDGEGEARIVAHGEEQEILAEVARPGIWRQGANSLRLDCVGEELTFWINGEQVLTATDGRYRSGRIGLRAGGGSGEATEAAFDNLTVTAP
jgi:hypothetical protein